jgi:microcystin-dependent protein
VSKKILVADGITGQKSTIPDGGVGEVLTSDGSGGVSFAPATGGGGGGGIGINIAPTIHKITSGSGTYTTPAHVSYLRVRMVGGGSGGGGSSDGNGNGGLGGSGSYSAFGSNVANGATNVSAGYVGGEGGSATLGSGSVGTVVSGGSGQGGSYQNSPSGLSIHFAGGAGGASALGGNGSGGQIFTNYAGTAAAANSGAGGGGAVGPNFGGISGSGGGAGGFLDAIIQTPAATYAYIVGTGGAGGAGGTNGFPGSAGGSGYIEITEYYTANGTSTATNDDVGTILSSASILPPTGTFLADGSAISRSIYSALFGKIGTTFGVGDGSTTFNLPNLQGVFLRGTGTQTISGISYAGILGATQGDQMQGHVHIEQAWATGGSTQYITKTANASGANASPDGSNTSTQGPANDGVNGTPRVGSETHPANVAVYYYIRHSPSTGIGVISTPVSIAPTIQKFTATGPNTYVTPANVSYIRVRMVGGGGPGVGSGNGGAQSAGVAGGDTTFGSSLLFAGGGSIGVVGGQGGPGGSASLGSGPIGTAVPGGSGTAMILTNGAPFYVTGPGGASSPLGGAGGGSYSQGFNAVANSGSGGGGGGVSGTSSDYTGPGGSAGGYVDAIITSPNATYPINVGVGGVGGTAGANGAPGGNGGSGYIEVTEYYSSIGLATATNDDVGAIISSASPTAPSGTFLADGTAVSRVTYSALFTKIGTTWGSGDGSTTFNLPNLQGVFLRGAGSQTIGGISYSSTLGAVQADEMQGHTHAVKFFGSVGTNVIPTTNTGSITNGGIVTANGPDLAVNDLSIQDPYTDGTNGTPRIGPETRPANAGVFYYIRHAPSTGVGGGAPIIIPASNITPTVQKFTSGGGTYVTPQNVAYLKVRMVGGGSGGGSSGNSSGSAGGAGTDTVFGLATAGGSAGGASAVNGGAGGVADLGVYAGTAIHGSQGGGSSTLGAGTIEYFNGISGAASYFGDGGQGGNGGNAGFNAYTYGSGGGGAGGVPGYGMQLGAGGGSGAYVEAIITSPSPTYNFSVGVGGAGGIAGGSVGLAGGVGGSGYLEITEYYTSVGLASATNDDVGAVISSASATAPSGTFLADGAAVSRTTYSALFAKIGVIWGSGDGSTTFNLPNFQGVFLRGAGSQTIGGVSYSSTFGNIQPDEMQGHIHQTPLVNGNINNSWNLSGGGGSFYTGPGTYSSYGPSSDGTNGTPRVGAETRPANAGVYYYIRHSPSTGVGGGATVIIPASNITPTIQKFTASVTGTYVTPANVAYLKVRMVGGGGGGSGSAGNTTGGSGQTGGTGGTSLFGSSLLVANGGAGGALLGPDSWSPGTGGSASIGSGAYGTSLSGGNGAGGLYNGGYNGENGEGGAGGVNPFGGSAGGSLNGVMTPAANTGAGGHGGSWSAGNLGQTSGAGGGAGGYIDAIITSPGASYSYTVGAAGAQGPAGSNGTPGSVGSDGYIEVTEYYTSVGMASATNDDVGTIIPSAAVVAPAGTFLADGTAVSRSTYAALFAKIVGDGVYTFNLPNLQGVFLRGAGSQTIGGVAYSSTLGAVSGDQLQGHAHQIYDNENAQGKFGANAYNGNAGASSWFTAPNLTSDGVNGAPRSGAETHPAHVGVNYYIRHTPSTGIGTIAGGSGGIARVTISTSTPVTAPATANTDYIYLVNGVTTITLPTAVGNSNTYSIKRVGTGLVTVATTASQTIDGSLTAPINNRYDTIVCISDGANWNLI